MTKKILNSTVDVGDLDKLKLVWLKTILLMNQLSTKCKLLQKGLIINHFNTFTKGGPGTPMTQTFTNYLFYKLTFSCLLHMNFNKSPDN